GPPSIPCISWTVHHHPTVASTSSRTTSPTRVRTAAHAGAKPPRAGAAACAVAVMRSVLGGPGELGLREARLPFVLDTKRVDPGWSTLGDREVGPDRVEHALEPYRLAGLHPEGDDVLDLEVDRVARLHAVPQAVVVHLDLRPLDPEHLPHERAEPRHRSSELTAEHGRQLLHLLVRGVLVDEHADAPVALGHHLRPG